MSKKFKQRQPQQRFNGGIFDQKGLEKHVQKSDAPFIQAILMRIEPRFWH